MNTATVVVWVLLVTFQGPRSGGPVVIDNISSRENCEALAQQYFTQFNRGAFHADRYHCAAVRKVVVK